MASRRDFIKSVLLASAAAALNERVLARQPEPLRWLLPQADGPWELLFPRILGEIHRPKFPNRTFNITRFGARGDGRTNCTEAFRRAIDECTRKGGGRVRVPDAMVDRTNAIKRMSDFGMRVSEFVVNKILRLET